MTPLLAVGTVVAVLALVGLAIGLVVLFVVIWLLQGVLSPLRGILADVKSAQTAPMLERGSRAPISSVGRAASRSPCPTSRPHTW
jgi:hypothetical protein